MSNRQLAMLYFEGKRIAMPWEIKVVPGWLPELTIAENRYPVRVDMVSTGGQVSVYAMESLDGPAIGAFGVWRE